MQSSRRTQSRLASTAALFGSTIEWYDFFVYGTAAATVFGPLFFSKSDPMTGLLAAFATFAVGFLARPLGGAIFGHIGDRFGRKRALIATLSIMGAATTLIGLLPTYANIGTWAPILLILLRLLQGISVGGEWGGSGSRDDVWQSANAQGHTHTARRCRAFRRESFQARTLRRGTRICRLRSSSFLRRCITSFVTKQCR
jgi:hypothetical protein